MWRTKYFSNVYNLQCFFSWGTSVPQAPFQNGPPSSKNPAPPLFKRKRERQMDGHYQHQTDRSETNWPRSGGQAVTCDATWQLLENRGSKALCHCDSRKSGRHTSRPRLAFAANLLRTVVDNARPPFMSLFCDCQLFSHRYVPAAA